MGCRTRVMGNVYDPSREIAHGRGNLSFTSINLPRIAIKAKGDVQWFFEELERKLQLVTEQLLTSGLPFMLHKEGEEFPLPHGRRGMAGLRKAGPGTTRWARCSSTAPCPSASSAWRKPWWPCGARITARASESQNLGLEIIGYMRKYAGQALPGDAS